jgi:alcohol dehydrogenase class IV
MDALTHAVEGVTATGAEPISDALNLHAIRMIFKFLPLAVHEPDNVDARGGMLIASCIAGMGFGNSMTGAVHATAHTLGGVYGIPHGLANAIMLPVVMAFNVEAVPERFKMAADAMGINVEGMDPVEAGKKAVQAVRDLKKNIGLTDTLKSLGVPDDKEKLQSLAETAMGDSQIGYNPNPIEEADVVNLYLKAMK